MYKQDLIVKLLTRTLLTSSFNKYCYTLEYKGNYQGLRMEYLYAFINKPVLFNNKYEFKTLNSYYYDETSYNLYKFYINLLFNQKPEQALITLNIIKGAGNSPNLQGNIELLKKKCFFTRYANEPFRFEYSIYNLYSFWIYLYFYKFINRLFRSKSFD